MAYDCPSSSSPQRLPSPSQPSSPCWICGDVQTLETGHASFQGYSFCYAEAGPAGPTAQQWLEAQQPPETAPEPAAAEPAAEPVVGTSKPTSKPNKPTCYIIYRREMKALQDKKVLQGSMGKPQHNPGDPCYICCQARTVDGRYAYIKGQFFCTVEEGPGGRTVQQWTREQLCPGDIQLPRTSAWNLKQRWERPNKPGGKVRKAHKLRICQLYGQPRQKDYGHSQHGREHFCALYEGKTVELWLAERRAKKILNISFFLCILYSSVFPTLLIVTSCTRTRFPTLPIVASCTQTCFPASHHIGILVFGTRTVFQHVSPLPIVLASCT